MKICDCKRDMIIKLANAYIEDYKRENAIYAALFPLGIYVNDEQNPYTSAVEKIFTSFDENFCSYLLDLASDGYVEFEVNNELVIIDNIETLYDFLFK